jgi:peptidoglycan-associated lipoprotein
MSFVVAGVGVILGVSIAGCARNSTVKPIFATDALNGGHTGIAGDDSIGTRYAGPSTSTERLGIQWPRAPYDPLYFTFDSYALSDETLGTLREYASRMQSNRKSLMIEGHCDERGTAEYNLALGEHRAQAVKTHLVRLGVDPQILTTISYGEELPADSGHEESAWSKNRRVEFGEI